ncbi:PHP domain-containing protein [Chloroflexota bacterium]
MSQVDLHIHSTASDGRLSPSRVVRKSAELGLTVIALADHDSVDGIAEALEAAESFPKLTVIPSVEINTDVPHGEAHVLGYFIDFTDSELNAALESLRNSRRLRAQRMIAKLKDLDIHIEWQRVQEIAGSGTIGRPHLALAMLEKEYIASTREAFIKYIGKDGPAYVEREKITPTGAMELILSAQGLPVLAHPTTINDPETMIIELKKTGLVGIEAYYDRYTTEQTEGLVNLAERHKLITTGGSDYHGLDDANETMIGGADVPLESAERLIALAKQRKLNLDYSIGKAHEC